MTRRSLVSVAALASVLVLGLTPTAAYAAKPTAPPSECSEVPTQGQKTFECDY